MDPRACILEAADAADIRNWDVVHQRLSEYREWRIHGGYAPVIQQANAYTKGWDGDFVYSELADKLKSYGKLGTLPRTLDVITHWRCCCGQYNPLQQKGCEQCGLSQDEQPRT